LEGESGIVIRLDDRSINIVSACRTHESFPERTTLQYFRYLGQGLQMEARRMLGSHKKEE
jgi:hypothetical protein